MSSKIKSVRAQEILDSRGIPTVYAEVTYEDASVGQAAVPSGASTGAHEAVELRDGDSKRYLGKGVLKAVQNIEGEISKKIRGLDGSNPQDIDQAMISLDGTPNKGRLGANAILAVSMANARAASVSQKLPLYVFLRKAYGINDKNWLLPAPMLNVINGGKHADSGLDVQEFMIVPTEAKSFSEALRAGSEIYQILKKQLVSMQMTVSVGDEGGFAPKLKNHEAGLEVLLSSINAAGWSKSVRLALDAASTEFYKDGKYVFEKKPLSATALSEIYTSWTSKYGLVSIEDPLAEDDWTGWVDLTVRLGDRVRLIGDDLFVTNPQRLARGIKEKAGNAILIKLNQIGSLTETIAAITLAQKSGFSAVISHRSGETEDSFIADLSVALNAGAIKTGAPCRSERLSKYNRLLQIETALGDKAQYAGGKAFSTLTRVQ